MDVLNCPYSKGQTTKNVEQKFFFSKGFINHNKLIGNCANALKILQRICAFLDEQKHYSQLNSTSMGVGVRTQFSKDDVDASDSLLVGLFDDDFDEDGGV
jgi:hypothetical protein